MDIAKSKLSGLCITCVLLFVVAGCGSDGQTGRNVSGSPTIDRVESASSEVHPGESVRLAVFAYSAGESSSPPAADAGSGAGDAGSAPGGSGILQGRWGEKLTADWRVDGRKWSIEGDGPTAKLTAPESYEANATVTVVVSNADDRSDTATLEIGTGENAAPEIGALTASPNPAEPSAEVALAVEADDARGDELSYTWSAPQGWSLSDKQGEETTLTAASTGGTFADIGVTVSDGYGATETSTIRVETVRNLPPTISSVTATPPQVAPGGELTLEVAANDAEQGPLTYEWMLPSGWSADKTDEATIEVTAPDSYGESAVARVSVEDEKGASAQGSVVISTRENDGPVITSLDANPRPVAKGGTISLTVDASDPNSDPLDYTWSVDDPQDWTLTPKDTEAELKSPKTPGVSTSVEVEVEDRDGATARASIVVSTERNSAPSVASLTANPQVVEPGGSTQLEAFAKDADGDSLSYTWTVPGGWSKSGSGHKITLTAPSSYAASGLVRVRVEDGNGGTATAAALVSTQKNQAPVLAALTANPQSVTPGGKVVVQATASDANGDTLSYSWTTPSGWSKSGSGDQITLTAPSSYGKQGVVKVTVADGAGGTANGSVNVETARNQSPVIANVLANPVVVDPGKTTTVTASASDPNGDPLTYAWNLPSGWTKSGSGNQIQVTAPNKANASATVTVTVSDGQGGQSQSAVVVQTASNRAPTIGDLAANPNPVLQNAETTVTATASDPDGDALSYSWSLDNTNWSKSGSGASITLKAPNKSSSSVKVTVTVSDGNAGTATSSISVSTKACASGKANCDGSSANGCEADLATDDSHCGSCGNACSAGKTCIQKSCQMPDTTFLVNERNAGKQHEWDPNANTISVFHQTTANDAECHAAEGSSKGWFVDHSSDYVGTFSYGSGSGYDTRYSTMYAYPKHVTVFSNHVFVMGRNDATIYKYDFNGNQVASLTTGNNRGQGMATDGTELFVSFWDGSKSHFEVYDASLNRKRSVSNPSGLSQSNIVDFAYDAQTGRYFGLAANYENGTLTETKTVVEFTMGGSVANTCD